MPPTRITKETLYLRREFTQDERLQMGNDLAQAHNRISSIEEEEAVVKAQFKERKTSVEQTIGTLSRNLANGFEMANVSCTLVYDQPNVGEVTYLDPAGKVVKMRAMTETERQMDLPLDEDKNAVVVVMDPAKSAENIAEFFDRVEAVVANGPVELMPFEDIPAVDPLLSVPSSEDDPDKDKPKPEPAKKSGPKELKEFHENQVEKDLAAGRKKNAERKMDRAKAGDTSDGW
jgi:hypothetical protein